MKYVPRFVGIVNLALATSSIEIFAATSGSLTLQGVISDHTEIIITPSGAELSLNLNDSAGITDLLVATVTEISNKKGGYTVTLASSNAKIADDKTKAILKGMAAYETHVYSIKYGGSPVTLANGEAIVTDSNEKTTGGGLTKNLTISFSTGQNLAADTYKDTLTLTIARK